MIAVLGIVLTLAVVGCDRQVVGVRAPTSFVDTLPLSIEQVRLFSGFHHLDRVIDTDEPTPDSYLPEGPCRQMADQRVAFGDDWLEFRSVADGGDAHSGHMEAVAQTIVGYPDEASARTAYEGRVASMQACAALEIPGLGGQVRPLDADATLWADDGMAIALAVSGSVIAESSVTALPDNASVALAISGAIVERIE